MKAGLNLYSICTLIETEEAFLKTADTLREMGYEFLQLSGCALPFDAVARVSEKSGLPIVLTHSPMDRILNDIDALFEDHKKLGCRYIGLGAMPKDVIADENKCLETIEKLEKSAKRLEELGGKLFYHNHNYEFFKYGDKTVLDLLVEKAPHLHFTLDTYWLQYGGADIPSVIEKLKGRIECVHLKDYKTRIVDENGVMQYRPHYAPLGEGTLDFKTIIELCLKAGTEYFLVEQDDAFRYDDPMAEVKKSIDYLKSNF